MLDDSRGLAGGACVAGWIDEELVAVLDAYDDTLGLVGTKRGTATYVS